MSCKRCRLSAARGGIKPARKNHLTLAYACPVVEIQHDYDGRMVIIESNFRHACQESINIVCLVGGSSMKTYWRIQIVIVALGIQLAALAECADVSGVWTKT